MTTQPVRCTNIPLWGDKFLPFESAWRAIVRGSSRVEVNINSQTREAPFLHTTLLYPHVVDPDRRGSVSNLFLRLIVFPLRR